MEGGRGRDIGDSDWPVAFINDRTTDPAEAKESAVGLSESRAGGQGRLAVAATVDWTLEECVRWSASLSFSLVFFDGGRGEAGWAVH